MDDDVPALVVLGVPIATITSGEALGRIEQLHAAGPAIVAFANAHTLNLASRDATFRRTLCDCDLVLNDGSGVALAARLQSRSFPENLNGTDFVPRLLQRASDCGWRVFLLGARPGIAARAGARLMERIPGLHVVGSHDGYFSAGALDAVTAAIRQADADLLLVAMGNPVQERWLADNLAATGAKVGVAVGAFFDFAAGEVPRSPAWVRRLGIEWLYRLRLEPSRMWRRYVLGNPLFVWRVGVERLRRGRAER